MQELFCKNKIFVRMYDCGVVIFGNWAYNWAVDKNLGGMRAMLCIKNGTIVRPEGRKKADLFIEDGKIVSVGGELPFDAVSYTHLDVYKRQPLTSTLISMRPLWPR